MSDSTLNELDLFMELKQTFGYMKMAIVGTEADTLRYNEKNGNSKETNIHGISIIIESDESPEQVFRKIIDFLDFFGLEEHQITGLQDKPNRCKTFNVTLSQWRHLEFYVNCGGFDTELIFGIPVVKNPKPLNADPVYTSFTDIKRFPTE